MNGGLKTKDFKKNSVVLYLFLHIFFLSLKRISMLKDGTKVLIAKPKSL